jgi:hypothetical protein
MAYAPGEPLLFIDSSLLIGNSIKIRKRSDGVGFPTV